jgi:integrase
MKRRTGYLFKRGDNFYVGWKVNGKAFAKSLRAENGQPITTKRAAEEARDKFMAPFALASEAEALEAIATKLGGRKAELARFEDQRNPALPLTQGWSAFLASPNRPDSGKQTLYHYESQWSAFADWMKEKHPDLRALRDVSKPVAEEYAASLNGGRLSPNTYNKHLNLLKLVFRVVKDQAKIRENPWTDLQRKHLVTHSRRELTVDELRTVCQRATGELRTLLTLGLYSGLRLGDCCTLRWCEVDLARGLIRRIPNKTARRNPKPVIVPIHPALRDLLSATPPNERGDDVLPETAALYAKKVGLVTDLVQDHFKSCGIKLYQVGTGPEAEADPESTKPKRAVIEVGFHSLRHTFVSLCRGSDAPLAVVESIVGHSNPAMTRHYTHVGELAATRAIAALPTVMGEARPAQTEREEVPTAREIRAMVESMTPENWQEKKAALLALLPGGLGRRQPGQLPAAN